MSRIGISYTPNGGSAYNFVLDNFGDNNIPRTYQGTAGYSTAASGTSIINGPAFRQKYQWVISSVVPTADAGQFDAMFRDWDQDRSDGLAPAVGVTDETFGATVNANAVFITNPSYVFMGPKFTMISFGLAEV